MDVHSKEIRSYNMSRIHSKNTKPELLVRKFLFNSGLRFRVNVKNLPGSPDIVISKYNTIIFVNGCFWHGHKNCKYFVLPKTRTKWWIDKINQNIERDKRNIKYLKKKGFKIITIWECQIKNLNNNNKIIRLLNKIKSND